MADYAAYFKNRAYLKLAFSSLALLSLSLVVNFYAGMYATERASNSVSDIVLSNFGPYNVHQLFVYGTFIFWIYVNIVCIRRPQTVPFVASSVALFTLIRSVFISLTHIAPYPTQIYWESDVLSMFAFAGDLFFSGHTGLPFLLALIFWKSKQLRWIFLLSSFAWGTIVLLGHLHYSIDVLAAFFITYSIHHLCKYFFTKEEKMFNEGI